MRGYVTDLDGPVHWIEFTPQDPERTPGPRDQARPQPPIVFVHGLGGSHLNWCLLGPHLAAGRRAVALDLHGFGLTPGLRANSTVQANARLLDRFIREVVGTPVILVGNSMGGLISILETAAHPDVIKGVVLIDPALPLPPQKPDWQVSGQFLLYALPGLGELTVAKLMRTVSPETAVQQLLQLCFADPSRADPEMIKADVALSTQRHPATPAQASARARIFLAAARSLLRVLSRRQRLPEDDGRHRRPGAAHRRRGRPAGPGGGHAPGRRPQSALGVRYPPRMSGTFRCSRSPTPSPARSGTGWPGKPKPQGQNHAAADRT